MFWNVQGKTRFLDCLKVNNDLKCLNNCDVSFLSETWHVKPFCSVSGRDMEPSPALPSLNSGRASGGLELYVPPSEHKEHISTTSHHIAVKLTNCIIVGVYYQPQLELDALIIDLVTALNAAITKFTDLPVLVGGDFNLHYGTEDFNCLEEILELYNIILISNPSTPTFLSNQGNSSTPDHIFASRELQFETVHVPQRIESDHNPLIARVRIPVLTSELLFSNKAIDVKSCMTQLEQLNDGADNTSTSELVDQLCAIFSSCQVEISEKDNTSHYIKTLKEETNDALRLCHLYKSDFFKSLYLSRRKQLHKEILLHKRRKRDEQMRKMLEVGKSQGITGLYKFAKKKSQGNTSSISLKSWFDFCSDLYQSFDQPSFHPVAMAPTESASELLAPISNTEVTNIIRQQHSSAKGFIGTSPVDIKSMSKFIIPLLVKIYNSILVDGDKFPEQWLTSIFFFLHKKGSLNNPSNYRSLAIEDPILKIFTSIICSRLSKFCEDNSILPAFQFGFRKKRSTVSAVSMLKKTVEEAFAKKKRVFACFVDFRKAFDLTNRTFLAKKLQNIGVPSVFAKLIFGILSDIKFRVRSNNALSPAFETYNGVPQGDPLSPLLYSIFTSDLPDIFKHEGPSLGNTTIPYILYADDLVILSSSSEGLQHALDRLGFYARKFNLTVNEEKTKCLIFHKGFCPTYSFFYEEQKLEICNNFCYLGVILTTQLSATKHVENLLSKCNTKIGFIFSTLKLQEQPLNVALDVFKTYVMPIIMYCLAVYFPNITMSSRTKLNSLFTKFLKRYLGLPSISNNAIVHYLTGTCPLTHTLDSKLLSATLKVSYPCEIQGLQIILPKEVAISYSPLPEIPSYFWLSPVIDKSLPFDPESRRALLYTVMDLVHCHICKTKDFHLYPNEETCKCFYCGEDCGHFHARECSKLKNLNPCALMRKLQKNKEFSQLLKQISDELTASPPIMTGSP